MEQKDEKTVLETISRNFEIPPGMEHVLVDQPLTCYASTHNTLYYSSPFKRSKARDVFPRYYRGGRRGNFGTWHGWEIVSLRGFCLDCWFRSREKWWLLIRLGHLLKNLRLYLFDNPLKQREIDCERGEVGNFFFFFIRWYERLDWFNVLYKWI